MSSLRAAWREFCAVPSADGRPNGQVLRAALGRRAEAIFRRAATPSRALGLRDWRRFDIDSIRRLAPELRGLRRPAWLEEQESERRVRESFGRELRIVEKGEDGKWRLWTLDHSRVLGTHDTAHEAFAQEAAIEHAREERWEEAKHPRQPDGRFGYGSGTKDGTRQSVVPDVKMPQPRGDTAKQRMTNFAIDLSAVLPAATNARGVRDVKVEKINSPYAEYDPAERCVYLAPKTATALRAIFAGATTPEQARAAQILIHELFHGASNAEHEYKTPADVAMEEATTEILAQHYSAPAMQALGFNGAALHAVQQPMVIMEGDSAMPARQVCYAPFVAAFATVVARAEGLGGNTPAVDISARVAAWALQCKRLPGEQRYRSMAESVVDRQGVARNSPAYARAVHSVEAGIRDSLTADPGDMRGYIAGVMQWPFDAAMEAVR